MTERSRYWGGTTTGDATIAPYDAETEFAQVLMSISQANSVPTDRSIVFRDDLNELAGTGSASPVSINTGRALVYGAWYENDAAVSVVIPTPAASTRIDRIVLRKSWAAQTVRITRIAGVEGGGAPALVQVAGTTWDAPLYQASIDTGGTILLTDERDFIPYGHGVRVHRTTNQAIPDNAATAVQFDGEEFDTDGYHDNVTNNTRLTVPPGLDGLYIITSNLSFTATAAGRREFFITSSSSSPVISSFDRDGHATTPATAVLTCVEQLVAGEIIEAFAYQNSGAPLDISPSATNPVNFGMIRIGG